MSQPLRSYQIADKLVRNRFYNLAELEQFGLPRHTVSRLVQDGTLESAAQGIFNHVDKDLHPHDDLALVSKRYPDAVIGLYTAAKFHDITQAESAILHLILPAQRKRSASLGENFWLEISTLLTTSENDLTRGVDTHIISGVSVKITNPERTIIDMWRQSSMGVNKGGRQVVVTDENFYQSLSAYIEKNGGRTSPILELALEMEMGGKALASFSSTLRTFHNAQSATY